MRTVTASLSRGQTFDRHGCKPCGPGRTRPDPVPVLAGMRTGYAHRAGRCRLTLAASPERYDLIVLDAFASDAIPVHLLTREAFAGYLSRLTARGVIVLHISNRHMALWRPAAAVGGAEDLIAYGKRQRPPATTD